MLNTLMTRDHNEAERIAASWRAKIGQVVGRFGRITQTLVGVTVREVDFRGRPLYQVIPALHDRDPLFDA